MDLLYLLKKWKNSADFWWKRYKGFHVEKVLLLEAEGAQNYLYRSKKVTKTHQKNILIISNRLFYNLNYYCSLYVPFQDSGVKAKQNTLQIRLWVMSYEVKDLVATKLSWVDPTSFVAMNSNTRLHYFTKLSGKSLDFYPPYLHCRVGFRTWLRWYTCNDGIYIFDTLHMI